MSQARKTVVQDPVVFDHYVRACGDAGYVGYTHGQLQERIDRHK